jgi:trafficking protein particle complex subunit 5
MNLSTRPRVSILDKPLSKGKGEVSLSIFSLLFSEAIQYSQSKVTSVTDLQNR